MIYNNVPCLTEPSLRNPRARASGYLHRSIENRPVDKRRNDIYENDSSGMA